MARNVGEGIKYSQHQPWPASTSIATARHTGSQSFSMLDHTWCVIDNESVRGSKECYGNTFPGKWSRVWALGPSRDPQMDSSSGQVT